MVVYLALALYAPSVIERVVSDPARVVVVTAGPTRRAQALSYTVKAGDTLSSIALNFGITTAALMQANGITNPNLLAVGQTIVIPPQDLTPGAAGPTAGATIVASPSPILRITAILRADSPPSSSGEMVIIQNVGSRVNMKGWTLADLNGNLYVFPDFVLEVNAGVRVHSDTGFDTGADLYWGRTSRSGTPTTPPRSKTATASSSTAIPSANSRAKFIAPALATYAIIAPELNP